MRRALVLLAALVLVGCGGAEEGTPVETPATTEAPATTAAAERQVLVYFLRDERLGVAARVAETASVGAEAVAALLEGPSEAERDAGLMTAVPEGTELLLEPDAHPAAKPFKHALVEDGIPFTSFAVDDVRAEFERLRGLGVRFTQEPVEAGPVTTAVFDDTCGNLIQIASQT